MNALEFTNVQQEIIMYCSELIILESDRLLAMITEECTHIEARSPYGEIVLIPVKDFTKAARRNRSKSQYVIGDPNLLLTHANAREISLYIVALSELPDYTECPHIAGVFSKLFDRLKTISMNPNNNH